jgi:uncharacterized membrane protein
MDRALFLLFLFLHVAGAIVAFGPTFAFSVMGPMAAREPQHAGFAVRVQHAIASKLVIPVGLSLPVTGLGMILVSGYPVFRTPWLLVAIALYTVTMSFAIFVQHRNVTRLVGLTNRAPAGAPGGPATGAGPGAMLADAPATARSGPPPEVAELVARVNRGGMFLGLSIGVIVFLMTVKPGGTLP